MAKQTRSGSFIEAVVNTGVGLLVAMVSVRIISNVYDMGLSLEHNIILISWMTAVSVGRSYVIRRLWNMRFWKVLKLHYKYRKIDYDLCCCGSSMGKGGSICRYGGCRSAKEYVIARCLEEDYK